MMHPATIRAMLKQVAHIREQQRKVNVQRGTLLEEFLALERREKALQKVMQRECPHEWTKERGSLRATERCVHCNAWRSKENVACST